MKLLVITQKVDINDDVLGFFHGWLEKLAQKTNLFVIANYVGQYNLPQNVRIFSLGKEKGKGKIARFLRYRYLLLKLLPRSDGVFYHMCPEYVLAAGLCPKIFRKKTLMWYTHKAVSWKLKLAERLVDKIFTASKESFRLPSKKVEITGHGIDVKKFQIPSTKSQINLKSSNSNFTIITVGRIAPVKNIDVLIEVAEILRNKGLNFNIKIAGAPALESDKIYFEKIKKSIKDKKLEDKIIFVGPIPNKNIVEFYQSGNLFVNFSDTGSMDKAVLEAMASGLEVLTSNKAFAGILGGEVFIEKNPEKIAQKIIKIANNTSAKASGLAEYVYDNHNLDNLINKIINFYANE